MPDSASYTLPGPEPNESKQQLRNQLAESERFLRLLLDTMDLANEVEDPSEFITSCLELICESTKRSVGIAWVLDRATKRLVYRSHVDMHHIQTAEFIDICKQLSWGVGDTGLPSLVAAQGTAIWVPHFNGQFNDVTMPPVKQAGLKCAFAFPITSREGVIGVFEFFGRRSEAEDVHALGILNRLGKFLGMVFERKDADRSLREIQMQQKALQSQLRATADEAIASARLKSEFVANVSHEIRTPLAGIMGMAELLETQENLDAEARDIAGFILGSAHNLLAIVNDLLDFSKLEAGKLALYKAEFSIADLLSSVKRSIGVSAEKKGLPVRTEIDSKIPQSLIGDQSRLTQILMNFGHNAVKFTESGEVLLQAELESITGNVARVRITVSDTGIGISPEAQKRLFEPFVQADGSTTRKYGGTGLGLSIAKKLTSLMDGEITLSSEPGKGSAFTVTVPLELQPEQMIG